MYTQRYCRLAFKNKKQNRQSLGEGKNKIDMTKGKLQTSRQVNSTVSHHLPQGQFHICNKSYHLFPILDNINCNLSLVLANITKNCHESSQRNAMQKMKLYCSIPQAGVKKKEQKKKTPSKEQYATVPHSSLDLEVRREAHKSSSTSFFIQRFCF